MKIVLVGFATSYKTSVGKLLSQQLNCPLVDIDEIVERTEKATVSEIFRTRGEDYFRNVENNVLAQLSDVTGVVACGGGSVALPAFSDFARNSTVVWLRTSAATVRTRLAQQFGLRPLFDGLSVEALQQAVQQRDLLYKSTAHLTVDTDNKTPSQVTAEVVSLL